MVLVPIVFMGFFVALVSVFLGLGGGILLVPLLPSLFKLTVHEAVATSVTTIFLVVCNNTYRFQKEKLVNWPVVVIMGPISAVTAFIAARITQHVDASMILLALAIILILVALRTLFFSLLKKDYKVSKSLKPWQKWTALLGGGFAGLTSGFAGVGSGAILSPLMVFLRIVKPQELSPTSNANMVCTTFAAAASFLVSGSFVSWQQWGLVRWDLALGVFLVAAVFSHLLRPHQNKLPFKVKTLLLSVLLVFLIVKIFLQLQ